MNDSMSEFMESNSNASSAMMHTIQRHRDILQVFVNFHCLLYCLVLSNFVNKLHIENLTITKIWDQLYNS